MPFLCFMPILGLIPILCEIYVALKTLQFRNTECLKPQYSALRQMLIKYLQQRMHGTIKNAWHSKKCSVTQIKPLHLKWNFIYRMDSPHSRLKCVPPHKASYTHMKLHLPYNNFTNSTKQTYSNIEPNTFLYVLYISYEDASCSKNMRLLKRVHLLSHKSAVTTT